MSTKDAAINVLSRDGRRLGPRVAKATGWRRCDRVKGLPAGYGAGWYLPGTRLRVLWHGGLGGSGWELMGLLLIDGQQYIEWTEPHRTIAKAIDAGNQAAALRASPKE